MTPGNENPGSAPPDWRDLRNQARMQRRMQRNQWRGQRWGGRRPIAPGLVLLVLGTVFLLNNLGFFDLRELRLYWPAGLIVAGLVHAIFPRNGARSVLWSGAMVVMGGLLLAQNLGYIHGNVWEIVWPVFLIFLGLSFLFRGRAGFAGCAGTPPWAGTASGSTANRLNEQAVFGGVKQRVDSQEFEGGYLSATFSGIEIDLRGANTKLDELKIQVEAVFGGIELLLPNHWNTTVRGSGVFGGFEDQTHPPAGAPDQKRPHLTVTGSAVFGGVSVRN